MSHLIDRIGRVGFGSIFDGLNDESLRMVLLSPETYDDTGLQLRHLAGAWPQSTHRLPTTNHFPSMLNGF